MSDIIDQPVIPSSSPGPLETAGSISKPTLIPPPSPDLSNPDTSPPPSNPDTSPPPSKPDTPPPLPPSPIHSRPQKTETDVTASRVSDAFRSCYGMVSTLVDEKGHPGVETLFSFTSQVIYIVETTVQSSGSEKKQIVLDLVTAAVEDFVQDPDRDNLLHLVHTVVPYCIDTVISVATGDINIGKTAIQAMQTIRVKRGCLPC